MRGIWLFAQVFVLSLHWTVFAQTPEGAAAPTFPRVWDDAALAAWHVPLAASGVEPVPLTAEQFYRLPELKIYRSYPVYAPGKGPAGYLKKLGEAEPELAFDPATYKSEAEWIRAGELVFDAPVTISAIESQPYITDATWYREHHVPIAKDGTVPFYRYIVRQKGKVEIGTLACSNCHTRVMTDGSVIKGAQGNFPRAQANGYVVRQLRSRLGDAGLLDGIRLILMHDYDTPWLRDNLNSRPNSMSLDDIISAFEVIPAGVTPCHNSSLSSPVQVPSLIGGGGTEVSRPHGSRGATRDRRFHALLSLYSRQHSDRFWRL